jgi:hypothetical protein
VEVTALHRQATSRLIVEVTAQLVEVTAQLVEVTAQLVEVTRGLSLPRACLPRYGGWNQMTKGAARDRTTGG